MGAFATPTTGRAVSNKRLNKLQMNNERIHLTCLQLLFDYIANFTLYITNNDGGAKVAIRDLIILPSQVACVSNYYYILTCNFRQFSLCSHQQSQIHCHAMPQGTGGHLPVLPPPFL